MEKEAFEIACELDGVCVTVEIANRIINDLANCICTDSEEKESYIKEWKNVYSRYKKERQEYVDSQPPYKRRRRITRY